MRRQRRSVALCGITERGPAAVSEGDQLTGDEEGMIQTYLALLGRKSLIGRLKYSARPRTALLATPAYSELVSAEADEFTEGAFPVAEVAEEVDVMSKASGRAPGEVSGRSGQS